MKKILLLAGIATFALVSNAKALEVSPYVSAKLSYDWAKNDAVWSWAEDNDRDSSKVKMHKNTWGGHYALGAKAGAIRTEVEYNHYKDTKKKVPSWDEKFRLQNKSLMFNVYYDINTCTRWTPYVGAGMGVSLLKLTEKATDSAWKQNNKSYNFAWQVGAGVAYDLTRNIALDAGYRYINAGAAVAERRSYGEYGFDKFKFDTAAHEIYLGARYTF